MVKQMTIGVGVVLFVLSIIIAARTLLFGTPQMSVDGIENISLDKNANANANAKQLGEALSFRTVSMLGGPIAAAELLKFHEYLEIKYPHTHDELEREIVNDYSLLYTWQGSDPRLSPIMILAHMDVVPVKQSTAANWTYPPFSGVVADDYIWRRKCRFSNESLSPTAGCSTRF